MKTMQYANTNVATHTVVRRAVLETLNVMIIIGTNRLAPPRKAIPNRWTASVRLACSDSLPRNPIEAVAVRDELLQEFSQRVVGCGVNRALLHPLSFPRSIACPSRIWLETLQSSRSTSSHASRLLVVSNMPVIYGLL